MGRERDFMRREFKKLVVPKLEALGFSGSGLHFQRKREVLDVLDLHHSKYGDQFVLEFASLGRGDLQTSWGEVVPEPKITAAHVVPTRRARLEQRPESEDNLFRGFVFGGFGEDQTKYETLAHQVASLLPEVDTWLRTGKAGSHVRCLDAA